jgi:hypothetical protein
VDFYAITGNLGNERVQNTTREDARRFQIEERKDAGQKRHHLPRSPNKYPDSVGSYFSFADVGVVSIAHQVCTKVGRICL